MNKRTFVTTVVCILTVSLLGVGCETMAGSAGTGAAVGGITGGIIGHQRGRGWEGAALGAALGGLTGIVVHDVRSRRSRTPEETLTYYEEEHNYRPEQGRKMEIERARVSPSEVRAGERAEAVMEYAVLGMGPGGTEVTETRALMRGGRTVRELSAEAFNRQDGTWVSTMQFEVPSDAEPGVYTLSQRVQGAGLSISGTSQFEVIP